MRIYGDAVSGNCLKCRYTADHLGIAYDWIATDIMQGETRTPEFLEMNPAGQVPVLELDDGRTLAQSNAIIAYLAAIHKNIVGAVVRCIPGTARRSHRVLSRAGCSVCAGSFGSSGYG